MIVGIMTDGHENASREWTHEQVKALIECQTKVHHWEFMYLGADQDAIEVGARMGIRADKSVTYARGKAEDAMVMMSRKNADYRRLRMEGTDAEVASAMTRFFDDDRDLLAR